MAFAIWTIVVFILLAGGALRLYYMGRVVHLSIGLTVAAACAAAFRIIVPALVRPPQVRPNSLVGRIGALQTRVAELDTQLSSLSDAFHLAKGRSNSRLIGVTKAKLKRSYALIKQYHSRFDAQVKLLQFSRWLQETAAIIAGWRRADSEQLSAVYDRLVLRTDNCRVAFRAVISGKLTSSAYAEASAAIREGLSRAESVADAMVARKAQLALASISPASIPVDDTHETALDEFATEDILRSTDELEREFDRIIAEHELGLT